MDNPQIKTSSEVEDLREQLNDLNHLVVSVLILLVVVSGTFTIFLLRQWQSTRKDLAGYKPNATLSIAYYNQEEGARMDAFVSRLGEYGKTNPDFKPILIKYGLIQATGATTTGAGPAKK